MFNILVSTKQILITLIKWWIFIWVQLTLLILCWYRGPGTGPGPKWSQVLLKKSAANRLVELFGEETLQDAQPLASRGSTGYTMLQLVGGWPTPLKNDGVSSSVGMMTFPTRSPVPNHQPVNHLQYAPKIFKASNCWSFRCLPVNSTAQLCSLNQTELPEGADFSWRLGCREAFVQVLSLGWGVDRDGEELLEPLEAIPGPLSKREWRVNGGGVWNWWSAVYLDLFGLGKFGGCIMWYVMICYVCDGLAQFLVVRSTVVTWNETNDSLWVSTGGSVFYLLGLPGRRKGATRQLLCTNLLISNQLTEI